MAMKRVLIGVMMIMASLFCLAQALPGTYSLVQDSDGTKPKSGAVIKLTLTANGTVSLSAVQPGQTFDDNGTYRASGDRMTMHFEAMDKGCTNQKYSLQGSVLTLPFKMLSDGPGASTWTSAANLNDDNPSIAPQDLAEVIARTLRESKEQDNQRQRSNVDQLAIFAVPDVKGGLAEAYYVQGTILFMKGYYYEAWYGFAKASSLQQNNAVYLNNLAMVLMELDKYDDAVAILTWVTKWFPNLDAPLGNLGVAYVKGQKCSKAMPLLEKAMRLSPDTGLYQYAYGKALACMGRKEEAKRYYVAAWEKGFPGSGREGEPGGGDNGGTGSSTGGVPGGSPSGGTPGAPGSPGRPGGHGTTKPSDNGSGKAKEKQFPPEWVGHYEARYVRARSGENAKEANTQFGKGMTGTNINLQTLACAKEFSMDISSTGSINGHGKIMYVYQGKAVNPAMGLMPSFAIVGQGGFACDLKGGYQIRDWSFSGKVDPDGNVEIRGIPEQQLDLINVGKVQKIKTWSALPPDGPGAAMRGPFHMTLATEKKSGPAIRVDQWLDLGDKLIRRVHYESYIVKSSDPITPDCKYVKPKEPKCPASEYIKTKVSMSPHEGVTVEATKTFTSQDGQVQTQDETTTKVGTDSINVDTSGKFSAEGSKGMFTGSAEFNPTDGSYAVSVGIGVDAASVIKEHTGAESPANISEKVELVYDSKCGFGIKATAGVKAGKVGAGVEGCVFFNKAI